MCHDGSYGSPFAVERRSNRTRGGDHSSTRGHANTPYGPPAAEAGQYTPLSSASTSTITISISITDLFWARDLIILWLLACHPWSQMPLV